MSLHRPFCWAVTCVFVFFLAMVISIAGYAVCNDVKDSATASCGGWYAASLVVVWVTMGLMFCCALTAVALYVIIIDEADSSSTPSLDDLEFAKERQNTQAESRIPFFV